MQIVETLKNKLPKIDKTKVKESFKNKINGIKNFPTHFEKVEYDYSLIKVIPFKTSYKQEEFVKVMNTLFKYKINFIDRFEVDKKARTLIYHAEQSLCYEIIFTKEKITYCYAVPTIYKDVFMNKIKFCLHDCEVEEIQDYLTEFDNTEVTEFELNKNSFFSLNTKSSINISDQLLLLSQNLKSEKEKVMIQYMFTPLLEYEWKDKWNKNYKKYCMFGTVPGGNKKSILNFMDKMGEVIIDQIDLIINAIIIAFLGEEPISTDNSKNKNFVSELTENTKHKILKNGFKTAIRTYVKSSNELVRENITRDISIIFNDLKEDNQIVISNIKMQEKATRKSKNTYTLNTDECCQLIRTPSSKMLEKYGELLDKVNLEDISIPKELFEDNSILLGEVIRGNRYRKITFGLHSNSLSKPLFYIGEMESGKSSFSRNYAIGALEIGHSAFIFDTIDGKNVTYVRDYLPKNFPEEKIIELDFTNEKYFFPCMWNEIADYYVSKMKKTQDIYEKYALMETFSSLISEEFKRFLDVFEAERKDKQMTAQMKSLLSKVAELVFMNKGPISMIKDCLRNPELRRQLINNLKLPANAPICKEISALDDNMPEITIRSLESRLDVLMSNNILRKYFEVDPGKNKKLDFAYWANNGYAVLIRIPKQYANVLATFLTQKLWLAIITSRRDIDEDKRPHTHLLIDEPNEYPAIMDLLKEHLIASRKWHLRFLFFVHNMEIFRNSLQNLRSSGVSIIMCNTNENNFRAVNNFFKPYTFDALDEVRKLQAKSEGKYRYALASIHYKTVNYPCVIRLPLPVEKRFKFVDRSYLRERCCKKYGISQREYYKELFEDENKYDLNNIKQVKIKNEVTEDKKILNIYNNLNNYEN